MTTASDEISSPPAPVKANPNTTNAAGEVKRNHLREAALIAYGFINALPDELRNRAGAVTDGLCNALWPLDGDET